MTLRSGWPVLSGTKGLLDRRRKETGATAKRRSSRTTRAARWTTEAAALDGCRLDDRHRPGRLDDAARREPGRLEQRGQLAHRALAAAGDGKHDDVEGAAAGVGTSFGENVLDDQHRGARFRGATDRAED